MKRSAKVVPVSYIAMVESRGILVKLESEWGNKQIILQVLKNNIQRKRRYYGTIFKLRRKF